MFGISFWFRCQDRPWAAGRHGTLALHRMGGYLFIALFCAMSIFMVARLGDGADRSPAVTLHLALALILSPLLFIKVLIARCYRNNRGFSCRWD